MQLYEQSLYPEVIIKPTFLQQVRKHLCMSMPEYKNEDIEWSDIEDLEDREDLKNIEWVNIIKPPLNKQRFEQILLNIQLKYLTYKAHNYVIQNRFIKIINTLFTQYNNKILGHFIINVYYYNKYYSYNWSYLYNIMVIQNRYNIVTKILQNHNKRQLLNKSSRLYNKFNTIHNWKKLFNSSLTQYKWTQVYENLLKHDTNQKITIMCKKINFML
jgi:hypothetical protein